MPGSSPSTSASAPSGGGCAMSASGRIALKPALDPELLRALRPAWVPAGILAATAMLSWVAWLPEGLVGLRRWGPYALLGAGLVLAWWFNRGRAFVLLASLLGAVAAWDLYHTKAVYAALTVLVPLNVLFAMLRPERGARYRAAYVWLALLGLEALFLVSIAQPTGWFDNALFRSPPTPLLGRLMFAAAFAAALWRAWRELTALQVGVAGTLAAFFVAAEWADAAGVYAAFMSAAGVIMIVALLAESHRLAFRDTLTGLPGRRALEERLRSLGGRYVRAGRRSEEHTSELQSLAYLVCRLLLEKKKQMLRTLTMLPTLVRSCPLQHPSSYSLATNYGLHAPILTILAPIEPHPDHALSHSLRGEH